MIRDIVNPSRFDIGLLINLANVISIVFTGLHTLELYDDATTRSPSEEAAIKRNCLNGGPLWTLQII